MKFLEHFNMLQSKPSVKSMCVCKTPVTCKPAHPNIDDTDSEDDSNSNQAAIILANVWVDEWQVYLNTNEDIPNGLGIVHWWGVCSVSLSILSTHFTNVCVIACHR